jgi:hypothetical protein
VSDGKGFVPAAFFSRLLGDVNGDEAVDTLDLNAIAASYGRSGVGLQADISQDGTINGTDRRVASLSVGRALNKKLLLGVVQ